jgi:hypothetical protein
MELSDEPRKKSPVTLQGFDPGPSRLVEQCLNYYATPIPLKSDVADRIIHYLSDNIPHISVMGLILVAVGVVFLVLLIALTFIQQKQPQAIRPDLSCKKVKQSRYRPAQVLRVDRGIALSFLDLGARRGWVVSTTPWSFYPRERSDIHCTGD